MTPRSVAVFARLTPSFDHQEIVLPEGGSIYIRAQVMELSAEDAIINAIERDGETLLNTIEIDDI